MTMIERVARAIARNNSDEYDWPLWRDDARAAIEAMREPTGQMVAAADCCDNLLRDEFEQAWSAMIDAALSEHKD